MLFQRRLRLTGAWQHHVAAAVELGLGDLDGAPHPRQVADLGDGVVERVVLCDGLREEPLLHRAFVAGQNVVQAVGVFLVHVGGGLCGAFHLQRPADEEGLINGLAVHPRGPGSRLCHHIDEVLVGEPLHRLAHRRAGYVELGGDRLLVDHLAGADDAAQDQPAHQRVDLVAQGAGTVKPKGGQVHRHGRHTNITVLDSKADSSLASQKRS